jgi:putative NADH-flavin reductase
MRIAIFGANGKIGQVVVQEALDRGHDVTAAVRSPMPFEHERLTVRQVDVLDRGSIRDAVDGHNAVVSAIGGNQRENKRIVIDCAPPLLDGMRAAGVKRLVIIGTAGTLEVEPGVQRMDRDDFPPVLLPEATAQRVLQAYLTLVDPADIEWTYFAPPGLIDPGDRTGEYVLGDTRLPFNSQGESYISNEDYSVALLDELERPAHVGQRFTATSERVP